MKKVSNNPESLQEVLRHHLSGGKFKYLSYDHKAAEAEWRSTKNFNELDADAFQHCGHGIKKVDKFMIPEEIRDKFPVWRNGKLRRVEFTNDGSILRVRIGNKYSVSFYSYTWDLNKIELI